MHGAQNSDHDIPDMSPSMPGKKKKKSQPFADTPRKIHSTLQFLKAARKHLYEEQERKREAWGRAESNAAGCSGLAVAGTTQTSVSSS